METGQQSLVEAVKVSTKSTTTTIDDGMCSYATAGVPEACKIL